ncbi:hypothetical protein M514_22941, partial [Trichuris suis]
MNTPPIDDRQVNDQAGSSANAHERSSRKIEAVYKKTGTHFPEAARYDVYGTLLSSRPIFTLSEPWIWWCHDYEDKFNCNWLHGLKRLGRIDTSNHFWHLFQQLGPPSDLPNGFGYYVFKYDATVVKEEPENRHGGKVVISMKRDCPTTAVRVNKCWIELTVSLLSGQFGSYGNVVNGVFVCSCLKTYSIGFWVHSRSSEAEKRFLCEVMNIVATPKDPARYEPHDNNFTYL